MHGFGDGSGTRCARACCPPAAPQIGGHRQEEEAAAWARRSSDRSLPGGGGGGGSFAPLPPGDQRVAALLAHVRALCDALELEAAPSYRDGSGTLVVDERLEEAPRAERTAAV